jgi:xyloglucan-specific endo-beta-1,4-glucanase
VAYDIFTSNSPGGPGAYEIMIWVAALGGAGPISSTGKPVATVQIAGTTWDLFKGPNSSWTVFSFVARTEQTSFNADLLDFFEYLIHNQGMPSTQYLSQIAAGTEPFSGSNAQLTTSDYVLSIS